MRKGILAYLRRSWALLEWIAKEKSDALVFWRSERLGAWRDLQPRWRALGNKIRLELRAQERTYTCLVSSIQETSYGARISLANARHPLPDPIHVVWEDTRHRSSVESNQVLAAMRRWLSETFPGCRIAIANHRADRSCTISGSFLRILFQHRGKDYLLLVADTESPDDNVASALTQALLWLDLLRRKGRLMGFPTIYLMVPAGRSGTLCHRSRFLSGGSMRVEVWEYERQSCDPWVIRRSPSPELPVEEQDFRWPSLSSLRWSSILGKVFDLAPGSIRRHPRFQDYDSLRIFGLEFARAYGPDREHIWYGVGSRQFELTDENFPDLRALVDEILFYRRPDSPSTDHLYYRLQAERWLECLVLEQASHLFPELTPESVYSQIPVYLGKNPAWVDVLSADRTGKLVIMELKVSEDPELPLQAVDYWGRVTYHNECGDFERRGFFPGLRLSRRPPSVYLVSPIFSFHDSTERIIGFLNPRIEVWKIAINEDWRCGVMVLRRTRVHCGDCSVRGVGKT